MFTGLVEATGHIESNDGDDSGRRLVVGTPLAAELTPGDSIAVNGVCLTATVCEADRFAADLSPATLIATSLGTTGPGTRVNLERPVRADARMGGHFVLGHVDAVGRVREWQPDGEAYWLEIEIPPAIEPLVISKGSIAVDGISLTVARLSPGSIGLQIIPFTRAHTSLAHARVGDVVNLEADVLGKYVARLMHAGQASSAESLAGKS
jgi:riboflavin synthase